MVDTLRQHDLTSLVEGLLTTKAFPEPHGPMLLGLVRARCQALLEKHDMQYMPAFKILDLVAELVNSASEIAHEPHLRAHEARALWQSHASDHAPLVQEFLLEASIERARYEPLMVEAGTLDALSYRNLILTRRWAAMLAAQQTLHPLPESWIAVAQSAVDAVIAAEAFHTYRVGPLLQYFAEILQIARDLHHSHSECSEMAELAGPGSTLWKRYALKSARFQQQSNPGQNTLSALPPQRRVWMPPLPDRHAVH